MADANKSDTAVLSVREGGMAAGKALLIINALTWLQENDNIGVDAAREDMDGYQTLMEIGLEAIKREVETAQRALEANHG
jgi:hypothetical protein